MNNIFFSRVSFLLSLTAFTVAGSGLSAQAETINTSSTNAEEQVSVRESLKQVDSAILYPNNSETTIQTSSDLTEVPVVEPLATSQEVATTTAPVPGTTATSVNAFAEAESIPSQAAPAAEASAPEVAQIDIDPGTPTIGGSSYVGVAGNIGLGGDSALGETSFAVISKIGLTNRISARPSVMVESDPVVLVPITYDFSFNPVDAFDEVLPFAPYVGAGVAIETSDDADVGPLLTAGVDFPLTPRFTATAGVNVAFFDDADVGLLLGVGYNFNGL